MAVDRSNLGASPSSWSTGLVVLLVSTGSYLGAQAGTYITFPEIGTAILFPPYAVVAAALMLRPLNQWWMYILAGAAGNFWPHWTHEGITWFVLMTESANALRALVAAAGVRWLGNRNGRLNTLSGMVAFLLFAVITGPAAGAFCGAAAVSLRNPSTGYWVAWQAWLLSNMLTGLTLLPLLLMICSGDWKRLDRISPSRIFEAVVMAICMAIIGVYIFDGPHSSGLLPASIYMPLPLLIWTAVRFRSSGTIIALSALAGHSIFGALHKRGPFVALTPSENLLQLQYFLIAISVPLLLLASIVQQQAQTASALADSERRYREVVESQMELVCRYLPDTTLTFVNDAYCRYFKRTREDLIGRSFLELVPPNVRGWAKDQVISLSRDGNVRTLEHQVLMPDGNLGWQQWVDYAVVGPDGQFVEFQGIGRDITQLKEVEQSLRNSEAELRDSYAKIQDLAGKLIAAEEVERKRIARELHDDINQQLAGLSIRLSGVKSRLPDSAVELKREMVALQNDTIEISEAVRNLSHELHPGILQHVGLVPALKAHCADFQGQMGIQTEFEGDNTSVLIPSDVSLCIYRVAQEALRNVAVHAQAKRVQLSLTLDQKRLRLRIADDGRGFTNDNMRKSGGLGLLSIEERVRLVRGEVNIESKPQLGTQIDIEVPLEGVADETR